MQLESINSEAEHDAALKEIERLWDAEEGSPDGDRLEALTILVEAFEESHFDLGVRTFHE